MLVSGSGDLLGRDVELARHRGHDLHQPGGAPLREVMSGVNRDSW